MKQIDQSKPVRVHAANKHITIIRSQKFWYGIGLAALSLSVTGYLLLANKPVIDRSVAKEAGFSIYAPKSPPEGYVFDKQTVKIGHNSVSYVLKQPDSDKRITVTVQPTPKGFNMAQMIDKGSIQSTAVDSGTLYNLSTGGSSQYLLDTGDALVFLTSPSSIGTVTINALASDLTKVD